jgi:hypothetical protein
LSQTSRKRAWRWRWSEVGGEWWEERGEVERGEVERGEVERGEVERGGGK